MAPDAPEVTNAVNASDIENLKSIAKDLDLELAVEHQIWCIYVWKNGGRFAVIPGGLPGKGMGIIATRDIKPEEQIAHIPSNLLYTTNSIPSMVKKMYPRSTTHCLLAAGLVHEFLKKGGPYNEWIATWPTIDELETSLPSLLPMKYREPILDQSSGKEFLLFPPAIGGSWINSCGGIEKSYESAGTLPKQERKMAQDVSAFVINQKKFAMKSSGVTNEQVFKWMWLMVNTRSFYYDMPLRTKPRTTADKMCLCPFLDYFNHDEKGCNVSYNEQGFSVIADRAYGKGEEVVISYGVHGNDLLWTDYGFLLNESTVDSVCIDAWMLDPSTGIAEPEIQRLLEDAGYWRSYTINNDGPCYRTETAIRTQILSRKAWQGLVDGKTIDMPDDQIERGTQAFLADKVLKPCIEECIFAEKAIRSLPSDLPQPMNRV